MKRVLETGATFTEQPQKRLKVDPDNLISIYFNIGPFPRVGVTIVRSSSVKDLKHALQYRTGLTLAGYALKHNGRVLKDKEQVESFAELVIDVVPADHAELEHQEWEAEPESEHEESSFAQSEPSWDSQSYAQPRAVNIAEELERCQGNIDPPFIEVLFGHREELTFKQWIISNIHVIIDAYALQQDVYAVDHLSEIVADAFRSPILGDREQVLARWIDGLVSEIDFLRDSKSPCTFKLIKYFAVLSASVAAQSWISSQVMDLTVSSIIKASQSEIILDNGAMVKLIQDARERLTPEQLTSWREKWATETYYYLHNTNWHQRLQVSQLTWIDFVLFADCALAPNDSERFYYWLVDAPYSAHNYFLPSIQFGIQIMKSLMENASKRASWIKVLSLMLEFYSQYQYLNKIQIQNIALDDVAKLVSVMETSKIQINGNKKLSNEIMDTIIRKHSRSLEQTEINSIDHLSSLSSDVMQFLETKSSTLTSLHIRMPHWSICCASTARLSRFNNLEKLSLCMPALGNNDFVAIMTQMAPQLTQLDLQGAEELRKCFSVISKCKKLKKLNLAQTHISYLELLDITDSCPELEELNISECWSLNEDQLVLAELFQGGLSKLRILDASGLNIQKDFQFMASQSFRQSNLQELTINNTLVDPQLILRVFPNLEVLESAHSVDMKDSSSVTEANTFEFQATNKLKSVNIASKGFSSFCKYIDCLTSSSGLEKLSLSNCPWITRDNVLARLPSTIKELDLSNCGLERIHVNIICQRFKNLERLNIARNSSMTTQRVTDILAQCPRLTSIDISNCFEVDIQEFVKYRLAREVFPRRPNLEIHIEGCNWTKESVVAFTIVYPAVRLHAGENVFVEAANQFLARITHPNTL